MQMSIAHYINVYKHVYTLECTNVYTHVRQTVYTHVHKHVYTMPVHMSMHTYSILRRSAGVGRDSSTC